VKEHDVGQQPDEGISVEPQDVIEVQQMQLARLTNETVMQGAYVRRLERDNEKLRAQVSQLLARQLRDKPVAGVTQEQPVVTDEEPMRA
jgi:hypothetical protein